MRRRGAGGRHTQVCAATLRAPRARLTLERMNVRQTMRLLTAGGTLATGAAALTYAAYRKTRYELEDFRVPTLVITAADDRYGTWPGSFYTAQEIANARFVGFQSGGHLLLGHREEVQALVTSFLAEQALGRWRAVAI